MSEPRHMKIEKLVATVERARDLQGSLVDVLRAAIVARDRLERDPPLNAKTTHSILDHALEAYFSCLGGE